MLGSRIEQLGESAVSLTDFARIRIEDTTIDQNSGAGLTLGDHSVASVVRSSFNFNGDGIRASGDAWFTVTSSTIANSTDFGVVGAGRSGGLIIESVVNGHGRTGLAGEDSFWLTLVDSEVRDNNTGLATYGGSPAAKYSILSSRFEENAGHAVTSSIVASLALVRNSFVNNGSTSGTSASASPPWGSLPAATSRRWLSK